MQELIGVPLNFIAGAALVGISGWIYQVNKTRSTAALALAIGVLVSSVLMVAVNFTVYPLFCRLLFQRVPGASELSAVLWSAVFPFNLGKGFVDSFLVFLVYKKLGGLLKN
ncbi:MAG: hypothetical protein HYU64_06265 [Armatimonadetes bacterium]|nr:hypothetical protein [Armatimonadota bacterium]